MKQTEKSLLASNQGGFTLIELIMVIVILGLLSVVAIPKYVDLRTKAAVAAANEVYAAAQSATAINFAAGLAGLPQPAGRPINNAQALVDAMDGGKPDGWSTGGRTLQKLMVQGRFKIQVITAETESSKAVLSKNW